MSQNACPIPPPDHDNEFAGAGGFDHYALAGIAVAALLFLLLVSGKI